MSVINTRQTEFNNFKPLGSLRPTDVNRLNLPKKSVRFDNLDDSLGYSDHFTNQQSQKGSWKENEIKNSLK